VTLRLPRLRRLSPSAPRVQALVQRRLTELAATAVASEGDVAESEISRVERLDRLVALLRKHDSDYRWAVLGLASAVALMIVLALYQARVDETEITLETETSELSFTLAVPQSLIRPTRLASLGAAGLSAVELPTAPTRAPRVVQPAEGVTLKLGAGDGRRRGQLTLDPGTLPAGTRVWLRTTDRDRVHLISLRFPDGGEVAASGSGLLPVQGPDVGRFALELAKPEGIRFVLGREVTDFTLELLEAVPEFQLNPELAVSDLRLIRVLQHFRTDAAGIPLPPAGPALAAREVSTIRAGALYFEELEGKKIDLRPGQELVLKGLEEARLLRVKLTKNGIVSALRAKVSGLETGPESARRSLMPNRAEWLESRHLTKLLWGGLAVWVSILGALVQWRSRKS
jgi:hypothetical protein